VSISSNCLSSVADAGGASFVKISGSQNFGIRTSLVSINVLYLWYSRCLLIETKDTIGHDFVTPI